MDAPDDPPLQPDGDMPACEAAGWETCSIRSSPPSDGFTPEPPTDEHGRPSERASAYAILNVFLLPLAWLGIANQGGRSRQAWTNSRNRNYHI
jgi:hypothetical protein